VRVDCGEIGPGARNLAGRTTLRQLIDAIAGCSVFVTNDSGPLHVASALTVPVVAIFGSTEWRSTGPFATRSVVLRRDLPAPHATAGRARSTTAA